MTGARGDDVSPEWEGLGRRLPRKDEIKREPAAPTPAPGIDPGKHIVVDQDGRLSTNDPRNEAANAPPIPLDIFIPIGEVIEP